MDVGGYKTFSFIYYYFFPLEFLLFYICGHCVTKVIKVFRHLPWSCYFVDISCCFVFFLVHFLLSCTNISRGLMGCFGLLCILTIYFIHEIYVILIFDSVTFVDK